MAGSEGLDFGEVITDSEFVSKANDLNNWLDKLEQHLIVGEQHQEQDMSLEEKVDYDLFALYAVNSLFWIKLKLQGIDPSMHPVKNHLQKVREMMQRKKDIMDKRRRPVLDKNVASRFIRNGLWQPQPKDRDADIQPVNKKIKFSDD